MYDVVRKGYIQVVRLELDGTATYVSQHVDEAEAIASANAHGERNGGGRYRLSYPDKLVDVRIIVQGAPPTAPAITVSSVSVSDSELDIAITAPASGPGTPFAYELQEALTPDGPWVTIPSDFTGSPLTFRRSGLSQLTTRHYRLVAKDSADPQRSSTFSAVASGTTLDITPNVFDFIDVTAAQPSTLVESNVITLAGLGSTTLISVVGGEYRINGGAYTSLPGLVSNQQTVQVRRQSSAAAGGIVTVTLTVGPRIVTFQVTTTTSQQGDSWFPNWPVMLTSTLQGNSSDNILDATRHGELADNDLIILQPIYPTLPRLQTRVQNIQSVRANRNQGRWPRFCLYTGVQQTIKSQTLSQQSNLEIARDIINSPTEGNPDWYVHRVAPNQSQIVEPNFGQASNRQINMAVFEMGLNSQGENYCEVLWRKWQQLLNNATWNLASELDGFFQDNYNVRPPAMWINNGATTITDFDLDGDGVSDLLADFSDGPRAAGSWWAAGHLESKAQAEANFPGFLLIPNSAQWDVDYFDGEGQPPLPLSQHPFYRKFDVILAESRNLALGLNKPPTGYTFAPGSVQSLYRRLAIQEAFLRPDSQNTITGRGCVMVHATGVEHDFSDNDDLIYFRFIGSCALLIERGAPSLQQTASEPLTIDELLLELGPPLSTRSMGTLNENTLSFSIRTPNFQSGGATFYWAEFQKGIVIIRSDVPTTGAYPSNDPAVACQLPSPGAGMKWQRINAATYVNPITGRAMRGQDTALNSGADAGLTVSLKPYHAMWLRRVPA